MTEKDFPLVSIVMATYNSDRVLGRTLDALKQQSYPRDRIEILIIDGGSKDETRDIAQKNNCIIIDNPQKDPMNAKQIGFRAAKGNYVIVLDHDEVLVNINSILNKVCALQSNPCCKVAFCSGYKKPNDYPGINEYISEYGDPFSLFYYRCSKNYRLFSKLMQSKSSCVIEEDTFYRCTLNNRYKDLLIELACSATMLKKDYFQENFDFFNHPEITDYMFYAMMERGERDVIIVKDDPILHYSVDALSSYLPKLRWRVVNNVYLQNENPYAFMGREKYTSIHKARKYLFPLYSFSIFFPLMESIIYSIHRKNVAYLWHPVLSLYVTLLILYHYLRKILHLAPNQKTYNGEAM